MIRRGIYCLILIVALNNTGSNGQRGDAVSRETNDEVFAREFFSVIGVLPPHLLVGKGQNVLPLCQVRYRQRSGPAGTNRRRSTEQPAGRMPELRFSVLTEFRRSAKPVKRTADGLGISGTRADRRNQPCLLPVA